MNRTVRATAIQVAGVLLVLGAVWAAVVVLSAVFGVTGVDGG